MAWPCGEFAPALPLGINVLRNDVVSAVAVAAAVGATFVRANVSVGAALTDQGVITGEAVTVQALVHRLAAPVTVWADVDVKHAAPLAPRPLGERAADADERGLAGAVIVSGRATGARVDREQPREVREAVAGTAISGDSGATAASARELLALADGLIVGTAAKIDGVVTNPVGFTRVAAKVRAAAIAG